MFNCIDSLLVFVGEPDCIVLIEHLQLWLTCAPAVDVAVRGLRQGVLAAGEPEDPPALSHWRAPLPVPVRELRQSI